MNELICVAPDLVYAIWPHTAAFIERALIRSHSDLKPNDIARKLYAGDALLWIATACKTIVAAATTEIINGQHGIKTMVISTHASSKPRLWDEFLPKLEQYAANEHCEVVRIYGRGGWVRALRSHGYQQPWIVLEKRVA